MFAKNATTGAWDSQTYIKPWNVGQDFYFGASVALSPDGTMLAVGAPYEGRASVGINDKTTAGTIYDSGSVYVYVLQSGAWIEQAYIKASVPTTSAFFGWAVSLSENILAVTSPGYQAQEGGAYLFSRNGTTWTEDQFIVAPVRRFQDFFGMSVSVSENCVIVGAHQERSCASGVNGDQTNTGCRNSGAAYVYRKNVTWDFDAYLKVSLSQGFSFFGTGYGLSCFSCSASHSVFAVCL